jgi:hypothetical protein
MGRPGDALARTEEAVAAFNASDDRTRIASRAAGQDAGVAGRAVMAWSLWFVGYPDRAEKQMTAALGRADEIALPHTEAYGLYYASILSILRGEFTSARLHAERCLSLSEAHGFGLWHNLARIVCGICTNLLDPSSAKLEDLRTELDDHVHRGQRMGITVLYALLCRVLLQRRRPDAVLAAVEAAQKIGRETGELLFEGDLCRAKARALLIEGAPDARLKAQPLLEQALAVARSQNARSIELLVARDLADPFEPASRTHPDPRSLRPRLRLVHRGLRNRRSEGDEGSSGRVLLSRILTGIQTPGVSHTCNGQLLFV